MNNPARLACTPIVLLLWIALATTAAAQPHSTGWFLPGSNHLHRVDMVGVASSFGFTNRAAYAATLSLSNRTVLVHDPVVNAIVHIDPFTLRSVGTFFASPVLSQSASVVDMAFDCQGDLYFTSWDPLDGIFRIGYDRDGITTVNAASPFANGAGNLSMDIDTGDLIVTTPPLAPLSTTAYNVTRDGRFVTTLATGLDVRYGTYRHVNTGDLYSGTCCGEVFTGPSAKSILRVPYQSNTAAIFLNDPVMRGGYSPQPDRSSAAAQQVVVACWGAASPPGADGLWAVDLLSANSRKLAAINTGSVFKAVPVNGRNLASVPAGMDQWDLRVSFPSWPGRIYVLMASASGVRPGTVLVDGRTIPLSIDPLTVVGLFAGLPPYMPELHGRLDGNGDGTRRLDLRSLRPGIAGARFHFVPLVLDRNAPLGIAVIGDPVIIAVP